MDRNRRIDARLPWIRGYATEGPTEPGERDYMIEATYRTGSVDILVTVKGKAPEDPHILNKALTEKLLEWGEWDRSYHVGQDGAYSDD